MVDFIWASLRELLNIFQATVVGGDLSDFSLDTVKMFYDYARRMGCEIVLIADSGSVPVVKHI